MRASTPIRAALIAAAASLALGAAVSAAVPTAPAQMALNFVKWNVNDLPVMQAFYEKAFGFKVKKNLDFPTLTEVVMTSGNGLDLALVKYKDGRVTQLGTSGGPIGFYLKDVSGAYQRAMAAGGKSQREPRPGAALQVAFVLDPEGHEIELLDSE
jgi:predicted enzyme related to lactoylglutathione lyase